MATSLAPFAGQDPVLVAGDFNATPRQGPYELMTRGTITQALGDASPSPYADPQVRVPFRLQIHPYFRSAYVTVMNKDPDATTHVGGKEDFHDCLDYIFHRGVTPVAVLDVPSRAEGMHGFPNEANPSDHAPIGARFVFH